LVTRGATILLREIIRLVFQILVRFLEFVHFRIKPLEFIQLAIAEEEASRSWR
jgi:hypothetical protein